ncbi:MAG TPA: hypothetical protein VK335_00345 [Bryobacteraceae bacterium]|nr:hypothetical protein [Bryobacteraceae bacterium]
MLPTLKVISADETVKKQREDAAQRVIACFGNRLPDVRLLCFLDDEDWQDIMVDTGPTNRGFYKNPRQGGLHYPPHELMETLFIDGHFAFDRLIYLHGTTCSDTIGLTMTFAHELQHFVQEYCNTPEVWAQNQAAVDSLRSVLSDCEVETLGIKCWSDVPVEHEANLVSKRITEELFGSDAVRRFIDMKIAQSTTSQDTANLNCIKELVVTSIAYDLASETKLLFRRLNDMLQHKGFKVELDGGVAIISLEYPYNE